DRTVITRLHAPAPLLIRTPQSATDFSLAVCASLGGGLLAGDTIDLRCIAEAHTKSCITTQSSTKIYRSINGAQTSQSAVVHLHAHAMMLWIPDPITCFAGAHYTQRQQFHLHPTTSLLLLDSFTSGRWSRGERWDMQHFHSRTDIWVDQAQILRDAIRLDPADGPIASPSRMGKWNCFATLLFVGPAFAPFARQILCDVNNEPLAPDAALIFSAAPLGGGAILRLAADSAERLTLEIRRRLHPLFESIGHDPWSRKF
ncbi:MAG TPA: urease accessory protein UreD, partial [Tepidisphaeraceae bacterium]|nr:urease accessory protein UreD [Tepidisphaeraceae bacterium]